VRNALARLDRRALRALRTRLHSPALDRAAVAYTTTGEFGAIWIAASLAGAALDRERRSAWLAAATLVPASLTVNAVVKRVVRRKRPRLRGLPPIGRAPATFSFPSGHAATSFAAAIAIAELAPRLRAPAVAAASLMAFTRPYLGVHYPSDVLVGAALGAALGRAFASSR
jgi:decaprenylphosphoryl-5-phosphoribose phosphatase